MLCTNLLIFKRYTCLFFLVFPKLEKIVSYLFKLHSDNAIKIKITNFPRQKQFYRKDLFSFVIKCSNYNL